jgi:hypothetical protein
MTERDTFEVRLAAAVHAYAGRVSTDLDPLELAHRIATSEPRRHGFASTFRRRGVPIPRRTWALLLLAALLTAMVAGMLVVGSQPVRKLPAVVPPVLPMDTPPPRVAVSLGPVPTCPPGSNPDKPGPVNQVRPVIGDGVAAMVFDRHAGRIVLLAQLLSSAETWTFDVCTNTWTRMHPDREPALADPTHLIYDVDSDATIANDGQTTWVYGLAANTWTTMGVAPVVSRWTSLTWTYDPVSGLVFAADTSELWSYDVETDAWASISPAPWPAGTGALAYDSSVDRIVAYARQDTPGGFEMWLFDTRTGTWSKSRADTPEVVCGMGWPNPTIVYDEAAERTVVSCNITVAYDATADRWESLVGDAGSFPFSVYDAVNKRLLGLGENGDGVLAFDLATRERIVLLEPAAAQPAPSAP